MCGGKCEEMEDRKDMMNALCVHSKDKIIMLFFFLQKGKQKIKMGHREV